MIALAVASFALSPATRAFDLAQFVERDQQEFVEGKMKPDFVGALPKDVARRLGDRLDAAAFQTIPPKEEFHSEGARLCNLDGVPAAWTVGRWKEVPVSLIVFKKRVHPRSSCLESCKL